MHRERDGSARCERRCRGTLEGTAAARRNHAESAESTLLTGPRNGNAARQCAPRRYAVDRLNVIEPNRTEPNRTEHEPSKN